MVIYHIDNVILDVDLGYGILMWEMTVSIRSSPISIWDIDTLGPAGGMQSRSEPGRLHVAEAAADILRNTGMFKLTDRGEMAVKGRVPKP
jgi:hypothetical protein